MLSADLEGLPGLSQVEFPSTFESQSHQAAYHQAAGWRTLRALDRGVATAKKQIVVQDGFGGGSA